MRWESHHLAASLQQMSRLAFDSSLSFRSSVPVSDRGQALSAITLERLTVIAFLHDAGKLHPGFQAKALPPRQWKQPLAGHLHEGAALFRFGGDLAANLCLADLIRWLEGDGTLLLAALAHHGRPFQPHDIRPLIMGSGERHVL